MDAFEFLFAHPRSVPPGTFVFILSDFLVPPPPELWLRVLERRWDAVPVVLQDPVWERSFPRVDGFRVEIGDVEGQAREVRLRPHEAVERARLHEERWALLLEEFARVSLEPVVVDSSDESTVLSAFLDWAEMRQARGGEAW